MKDYSQELVGAVEECGLPHGLLMRAAGLDYDTLSLWRTGKRKPRKSSLRKIAAALRGYAESHTALADKLDRLAGD